MKPVGDKFTSIRYHAPNKADMAIILVFFNPVASVRLIQNILTVKHSLDTANIPYFIGELAFNSDPFLFNASANIFQYRSDSYMFYKENLIKAVEARIPDSFTKLCILDADIMFDNPYWYSVISQKLDTCKVCQPYTIAYFLDIRFRIEKTKTNCVDLASEKNWAKEHPGHIWAFVRQWYRAANISDMTVVGGGDMFLYASLRDISMDHPNLQFYICIHKHCEGNPTSCSLNIYHLNHGPLTSRQYVERLFKMSDLMKELGATDITQALCRREDGILVWRPEYKERINAYMLRYFSSRNDDV